MVNEQNKEFFETRIAQRRSITFDSVLAKPAYSDVMPKDVDVSTRISRQWPMKIPIVSAAMDTVTENAMAIAMAMNGGCGVIHRNLEPDMQAKAVAQVRFKMSGFVSEPKTVSPDMLIGEHLARQEARKRLGKNMFDTFPVVHEEHGRKTIVGLITKTNIKYNKYRPGIRLADIMTPLEKLVTAPPGTDPHDAWLLLKKVWKSVLPVVDPLTHELLGLFPFDDLERKFEPMVNSLYNTDDEGKLIVAGAVGADAHGSIAEKERARILVEHDVNLIVIDSSHAHSKNVVEMTRFCKREFPGVGIVTGNAATYEGARMLIGEGTDAVKVGIGPGSICTTRGLTRCGVPQLTAVYLAAKAKEDEGSNVAIIADGGMSEEGHLVAALIAGADCGMFGTMLAGTDECPVEIENGYAKYRGMGSPGAMRQRAGQNRYMQTGIDPDDIAPQGVEGKVPYKGPVKKTLARIVNGVRTACGLVGARNLEELRERAVFDEIPEGAIRESNVHDVLMVK